MSEQISYHCGGRGAGGGGAGGGGAGGGGGGVAGTGMIKSKADALARFNKAKYSKNATNVEVFRRPDGTYHVRWTNTKSKLNHIGSYFKHRGTWKFGYV